VEGRGRGYVLVEERRLRGCGGCEEGEAKVAGAGHIGGLGLGFPTAV
jgi:hypothetical protein